MGKVFGRKDEEKQETEAPAEEAAPTPSPGIGGEAAAAAVEAQKPEPPSEVDPGDRGRLLARCHVSNVEPVTWQENMRRRNRRDREEPFEDLLGLWN